jgi:hypothetical protein
MPIYVSPRILFFHAKAFANCLTICTFIGQAGLQFTSTDAMEFFSPGVKQPEREAKELV